MHGQPVRQEWESHQSAWGSDLHQWKPVLIQNILQEGHRKVLRNLLLIEQSDVSTHFLTHPQDAVSSGINAYVLNEHFRTWHHESCRDKVGGGRDVPGNFDFLSHEAGS